MATEMSIPLTLRERRMADRNYEIGDPLMVLASFANHELTTMMLQLNCEDCSFLECGEFETAAVTKIDALQSTGWLPQFVHVEFGD